MLEKIKKNVGYVVLLGTLLAWFGGTKFADKEQNTTEHQGLNNSIIEMRKDVQYIRESIDELKARGK